MPCKLRYSLTALAAIALVAASAISSAQAQAKFKNTTGPTKGTNMAPWTTTHASNRSNAIPIALLFFNLGVEIGQLAFVAAVFAAGSIFQSLITFWLRPALAQRTVDRLDVMAAYVIGGVAAFWLIERTSAFFV